MIFKFNEKKEMWQERSPQSATVFALSRYATYQPEQGVNIRFYKKGPNMKVFLTTQIYTHVSEHNFKNFKKPLDELL